MYVYILCIIHASFSALYFDKRGNCLKCTGACNC